LGAVYTALDTVVSLSLRNQLNRKTLYGQGACESVGKQVRPAATGGA